MKNNWNKEFLLLKHWFNKFKCKFLNRHIGEWLVEMKSDDSSSKPYRTGKEFFTCEICGAEFTRYTIPGPCVYSTLKTKSGKYNKLEKKENNEEKRSN